MGLAAPRIAPILIVAGYASGSLLLMEGIRPISGTTAQWLGVQMTPTMVDLAVIVVFACIAFLAVVALWRRWVLSYM